MYENSINDLLKAHDAAPTNPQILYKLGLSFYADGQFKKCVKQLKLALQNKPYISYESDIYYHIGLAYCNQEKFEKSIYPYKKVSQNHFPTNKIFIKLKAYFLTFFWMKLYCEDILLSQR